MAAYEVLLLNTAIPQIQAAQSGDTYVVPRDIAFSTVAKLADGTAAIPALSFSTDPDTGLFSAGANILGFAANGAEKAQLSASSFILRQSSNAANTSVSFNTTVQNALTLDSSGNLGLGVTPSGNYSLQTQSNFTTGFLGFNLGGVRGGASGSGYPWIGYNIRATNTSNVYNYDAPDVASAIRFDSGIAFFIAGSGTAGNAITFTQAMTLDASGNLVVGAPTAGGVGVTNYASGIIRSNTTGTTFAQLQYSSSTLSTITTDGVNVLYSATNALLLGAGGATERARITSGGALLVNNTAAINSELLGVVSAGNAFLIKNTQNTGTARLVYQNGAGTIDYFYDYAGATNVGSITNTTSAVSYNTSSDYRLKDNPQPLTGSGAFIDALQPKTWDWKVGGKGVGFIAHEVQEVSPGSVVGTKDAVDADGKPIMQAMEYGSAEFIANIIAELQSLRARVATLEQGA